MIEKDLKSCFSIKKLISTSKQRAEHPLAGWNTQQKNFNYISNCSVTTKRLGIIVMDVRHTHSLTNTLVHVLLWFDYLHKLYNNNKLMHIALTKSVFGSNCFLCKSQENQFVWICFCAVTLTSTGVISSGPLNVTSKRERKLHCIAIFTCVYHKHTNERKKTKLKTLEKNQNK